MLDASVALAWCFSDETSPLAVLALKRLGQEDAVVPAIWPLEIANGLRTAERRGRLDGASQPRIRALLISLPVRVEGVGLDVALGEISEVARSRELSAYDASYLLLAARRGLVLATVDERLRRASVSAGVALLG